MTNPLLAIHGKSRNLTRIRTESAISGTWQTCKVFYSNGFRQIASFQEKVALRGQKA